ncbi:MULTISPECIES: hypothetical protein [Serratia]|uniref:Uncharacterized protein n=1 Tax=Serratia ficaria TaxID=61651 RepID=A0A240BV42_SERFI|nr:MULTISPECIES: hypothetical protein [Serratia]REF45222.1 hypothetical protein C7332_3548 [Serratia ficaria]CAI0711741.1 Uncharacterised protein [Serratia ficaria]CAI0829249.1 Uncharacterised protein [Serratia ficaria]CAI0871671.1 Uncharacterised protein [Serratia ficaria]CAI0909283.1 Uncharacterised protein [Serratia ficaria]
MQEIDAKYFHLIAGAGNFADKRDGCGRVNNAGKQGKKGSAADGKGFYGKHTSPDCVNGIISGSLAGPLGMAAGALNGGCFKDGRSGGGNVGMGKGGNKSNGSCNSGKSGSCSR